MWRGLYHWKYFWHAITSAKKMLSNMRTSPNSLPPAIAFHSIQSVHLSACLRVTLRVHMVPSLLRYLLSFIFSLSLDKRAVIVRWFRALLTLSDSWCIEAFYICCFPDWTMQCCVLFSVSIFLVIALSYNVKQQSQNQVLRLYWKRIGFTFLLSFLPGSCRKDFFPLPEQLCWGFSL